MRTIDNLHNFGFGNKTTFHSSIWNNKSTYLRQITFDTGGANDNYFILDKDTLYLYVYFEYAGTKDDLRILFVGAMPVHYVDAVEWLAKIEVAMLSIIEKSSISYQREIHTASQLQSLLMESMGEDNYLTNIPSSKHTDDITSDSDSGLKNSLIHDKLEHFKNVEFQMCMSALYGDIKELMFKYTNQSLTLEEFKTLSLMVEDIVRNPKYYINY